MLGERVFWDACFLDSKYFSVDVILICSSLYNYDLSVYKKNLKKHYAQKKKQENNTKMFILQSCPRYWMDVFRQIYNHQKHHRQIYHQWLWKSTDYHKCKARQRRFLFMHRKWDDKLSFSKGLFKCHMYVNVVPSVANLMNDKENKGISW